MAPRPLPPCNGTLVPRPVCQNGSSPSPLLEVRTPIAIAIWGIMYLITCTVVINHYVSNFLFRLVNSVQKLLTTYKVTHKINPKTQLPTQAKGYKKRCYSTAKTLPALANSMLPIVPVSVRFVWTQCCCTNGDCSKKFLWKLTREIWLFDLGKREGCRTINETKTCSRDIKRSAGNHSPIPPQASFLSAPLCPWHRWPLVDVKVHQAASQNRHGKNTPGRKLTWNLEMTRLENSDPL